MEAAMIVMAVASVGSAIGSGMQQKQAAQDQKKAGRLEIAMQAEQNKKSAISSLREARIRRASIQALAENTGSKGSGEQGAVGSIGSMAGAAYGYQQMQAQNARNIGRLNQRSADSMSKANAFESAGKISDMAFNWSSKGVGNT